MDVYHGKVKIGESLDFAGFKEILGRAIVNKSTQPFLLVRDDDARMQVVPYKCFLLLAVAFDTATKFVSYGSTYAEGVIAFQGIGSACEAAAENFIDAVTAVDGIYAFFHGRRLSDAFDMCRGIPDPAILQFPTPLKDDEQLELVYVDKVVEVSTLLRVDMGRVCGFLDEVEDDPDENIDYDDAIQIGGLVGGRTNKLAGAFSFYYLDYDSGEMWIFNTNRTVMDGIADGSITTLSVSARVPRLGQS